MVQPKMDYLALKSVKKKNTYYWFNFTGFKEIYDLAILRTTILLILFFLGSLELEAAHIIGGEITYVCTGNGKYDFTMRIYRDCAGSGACFDSDQTCSRTSLEGNITFFDGIQVIGTLVLGQPEITRIEPNLSNPCLIAPPNVCVEQGVYRFSAELDLNSEGITVSYQRCCRNNTITNIINPRTSGSTYTTTLFPITIDSCNSSPTFNDFPPIVICRGEDVNFDHSASDIDGDSLVYSFCEPYYGGGWDGDLNTRVPTDAPNGLAPNPETPPGYTAVRFTSGYSFAKPLNIFSTRDEPPVSIDPVTGLISGFPGVTGQYVVGVCVRAYDKNGVLMNEVRRDFQFNVAECRNGLVSDVEETELRDRNGELLYYIRICGDGEIINESRETRFIENQFWSFDIPGSTITSTKFDPSDLVFPGAGLYDGILILNRGFPNCTDTALIQVDIYPEVVADFDFEYDTCKTSPVEFTNLSYSDAGPNALRELKWELDTFGNSFDTDVSLQFAGPGRYDITLTAKDLNECTQSITKEVPYFPIPEVIVIAPSTLVGCVPAPITFENLTNPINNDYDIIWDFGDGNMGTGVSPTHIYEEVGIFPLNISVTSPFGCQIDTAFGDLITTLPSPIADFSADASEVSRLNPIVTFTDESIDAVRWNWLFEGFVLSFEEHPVYTFRESGRKQVRLVVTAANGCTDTTFSEVLVVPDIAYKLPNAFTPYGDGVNDRFFGVGNAEEAESFRLTIWNRWGELIFETDDANEGWNGQKFNTGKLAPNGVYVVVVQYVNYEDVITTLDGFVTVLR